MWRPLESRLETEQSLCTFHSGLTPKQNTLENRRSRSDGNIARGARGATGLFMQQIGIRDIFPQYRGRGTICCGIHRLVSSKGTHQVESAERPASAVHSGHLHQMQRARRLREDPVRPAAQIKDSQGARDAEDGTGKTGQQQLQAQTRYTCTARDRFTSSSSSVGSQQAS